MRGLYLTSDLLFASRVGQAARRQGLDVEVVGSEQALLEKSGSGDNSLVILDLGRVGLEPEQLISELREHSTAITVVAYGPHVDEAILVAARSAGCDLVLTRGQFDREMSQLLAKYLS